MSQALNNAEHRARLAANHARNDNFEEAIIELTKAVNELVADNKRLDRELTAAKPRSGQPVY